MIYKENTQEFAKFKIIYIYIYIYIYYFVKLLVMHFL